MCDRDTNIYICDYYHSKTNMLHLQNVFYSLIKKAEMEDYML